MLFGFAIRTHTQSELEIVASFWYFGIPLYCLCSLATRKAFPASADCLLEASLDWKVLNLAVIMLFLSAK